MDKLSRRDFIGATIAAAGIVGARALIKGSPSAATPSGAPAFAIDPSIKSPTDKVKLGKSGLMISLVGIGTGTIGVNHASNQTRLGQGVEVQLKPDHGSRGVGRHRQLVDADSEDRK